MSKKRQIFLLLFAAVVTTCFIFRKPLYKFGYKKLGFLKHNIRTLDFTFSNQALDSINENRSSALKSGIMDFDKSDFVEAKLSVDNTLINVKARLKGDFLDHIKGEKWSYRVQSDTPINGITRFSIQHPMRRNNISEFFWGFICEKEGILKIDYELIHVKINGEDKGIYAFEEHFNRSFTKRRSLTGFIVRFDERDLWKLTKAKEENAFHKGYELAVSDSYDTKFLKENGYSAKEDSITKRMMKWKEGSFPTEKLFNTKKLATYFALADVCSGHHGITWHNLKFYVDTNTMLLEPIAYDGDLYGSLTENELLIKHSSKFKKQLFSSISFKNYYLEALNNYSSSNKIENLINDFEPENEKLQNILNWEFPSYEFNSDYVKSNLKTIRKSLKKDID